MESSAMRSGAGNVTIYLVPPKPAAELGDVTKKLKRSVESGVSENASLGTIHADASRLRECSKYFDICMSERWMTDQTQREFELEAQTEVKYYRDCFARMHDFPCKPIASVWDCIQLLRVASQIDFAQVLDIGVKYLVGVPWSDEEEEKIRDLHASGQLALGSASDLCKRLQVPASEEERQLSHFNLTERVLRRSLAFSRSSVLHARSMKRARKERLKLFQDAFEAIMRGSEPGKCSKLVQIAFTIVMEELQRVLVTVKKVCLEGAQTSIHFVDGVYRISWIFNMLQGANSSQGLVELVLRDQDLAPILRRTFQTFNTEMAVKSAEKRWARMMCIVFIDVLRGRLFLTASERLHLFDRWNWVLNDDTKYENEAPLSAEFVLSFISTFPLEDQEGIFSRWLSVVGDPAQRSHHYDLSEVHVLWIKLLVAKAGIPDAPKCSKTGETSGRKDG